MTVRQGEFVALLGGNGTGKSTTLRLLSEGLRPYRGTVRHTGRLGVLPQNPQALFVKRPSGRICSRPSTDCICPWRSSSGGWSKW
ncbi:MAG: ATP-binding cassette domain-containing protein [Oscillospiraceae bacterium]